MPFDHGSADLQPQFFSVMDGSFLGVPQLKYQYVILVDTSHVSKLHVFLERLLFPTLIFLHGKGR